MRICFHTFGCKLNQAETEELEKKFKNQNWQIADKRMQADVHFINACVVTQKAEKEVRQLIHFIKKRFPNCFLVVAGCFTLEMEVKEKQNVDLWLKNQEKQKIGKILLNGLKKRSFIKESKIKVKKRTRSLIKIQSGCQHYCSYCIVPFLRKKIISRSVKNIIQDIREKEEQGYQEIVLVGTNIGLYTDIKKGFNLIDLLKEILIKTNIPRIRLSSLWPTNINTELLSLTKKESRLCPHFHLSVQSASNKILKMMDRQYTQVNLNKIIKKIYQIPNVNLTTDMIVGFPGETDLDFTQTMEFVKKSKFLKVHVFRFSSRPETKAADLKEQISEKTKQKRSIELIKLSEKVGQERKIYFLNHKFSVLVETLVRSPMGEAKQGRYWQGLTSNYLKVFIQSKDNLKNKIVNVKLVRLYKDGIIGVLD